MDFNFIIVQIIGVFLLITDVICMNLKNKWQILSGSYIINIGGSIQYFILGAYSGISVNILAILQLTINLIIEKKGKKVPILLTLIYICVSIITVIIFWSTWSDIFPLLAAILFPIKIYPKNPQLIRIFSLINYIIWLCYNIIFMLIPNIISGCIAIIATLIGLWRYRKKKLIV